MFKGLRETLIARGISWQGTWLCQRRSDVELDINLTRVRRPFPITASLSNARSRRRIASMRRYGTRRTRRTLATATASTWPSTHWIMERKRRPWPGLKMVRHHFVQCFELECMSLTWEKCHFKVCPWSCTWITWPTWREVSRPKPDYVWSPMTGDLILK